MKENAVRANAEGQNGKEMSLRTESVEGSVGSGLKAWGVRLDSRSTLIIPHLTLKGRYSHQWDALSIIRYTVTGKFT